MNVSELARRMKVNPVKLLEALPQHGIDVGRRALKIDDRVAERVLRLWQRGDIKIVADEGRNARPLHALAAAQPVPTGPIVLPARIVVHEFARSLGLPVTGIIRELMRNGVMATINQEIDYDTAAIIAEDLGRSVVRAEAATDDLTPSVETRLSEMRVRLKTAEGGVGRPPVVVVMGHVDHGKTKLLDVIRKTNVMATESGGITQHIGAYQVEVHPEGATAPRTITFLDTPGHEAFRAMRTRGGKVADVAILVVAADDGVQPQTKEAIQIIKNEQLPFVVALNKIDKNNADPEHAKSQLSEAGIISEDWGGNAIIVPISAKEGRNIDKLLEMVLTVADMADLKAESQAAAIGTVIESHQDSDQGVLATVVVQNGTLRQGDLLVSATTCGRVRSLTNHRGEKMESAGPGTPAQILGLKFVPEVGDVLEATADARLVRDREKDLRDLQARKSTRMDFATATRPTAIVAGEASAAVQKLKIILKCDVLGSEEAILESLGTLHHPDVSVELVSRGLGNVTESDVATAEATGAVLLAFRVLVPRGAADLATTKKVEVQTFQVIYGLLDVVRAKLEAMLLPEIIRTDLGELNVLAIFRAEGQSTIAGGRVEQGLLKVGATVQVKRNGEVVGEGKIGELQQSKIKVSEVDAGTECGLKIIGHVTIEVGDRLMAFTIEERRKKIGV